MFNPESPLMQTLDKIADLLVLSGIWFLLCLTVVGFGPATAALYYAVVKSVRRERGGACREFFHALRENWKLATVFGLLFTGFGAALLLFDLPNLAALFVPESPIPLGQSMLSVIKTVLVCGIGLYVFPLISRYQVTFLGTLLTSLTLAVRYFYYTFLMLLLLTLAVLAIAAAPWLILILPGGLCVVMSCFLEPVLRSILRREDLEQSGGDPWYLE